MDEPQVFVLERGDCYDIWVDVIYQPRIIVFGQEMATETKIMCVQDPLG
jgi:hypothetical protein